MSLHDLPEGRIKVRWRDAGGTHRAKTFTPKLEPDARKRRKLAQEYERERMREVELGVPALNGKRTLREVVGDFVPGVIDHKAPKTQALYRSLWNAHLEPAFGRYPVSQITTAQIEDWIAHDGVGVPTQRKALVLLGQMFRFAQKRGWAIGNPVELVDRPKLPAIEPVHPPTPEEVERIRRAFRDADRPLEAVLVSVIAYAGLRPKSEALALARNDVRDRTLLVRAPKTNSFRAVDILAPLREDLDSWLRRPNGPSGGVQTVAFGNAPVFPNGDGQPWTLTQYENWRERVWDKVADFPPKDLRHTFVSLLIRDESYSRREVADQAGHSLEVQDRVYSHVWAELRGTGTAEDAILEARNGYHKSGITRHNGGRADARP